MNMTQFHNSCTYNTFGTSICVFSLYWSAKCFFFYITKMITIHKSKNIVNWKAHVKRFRLISMIRKKRKKSLRHHFDFIISFENVKCKKWKKNIQRIDQKHSMLCVCWPSKVWHKLMWITNIIRQTSIVFTANRFKQFEIFVYFYMVLFNFNSFFIWKFIVHSIVS